MIDMMPNTSEVAFMIRVAIVEDIDDIRKGLSVIINEGVDIECTANFSTAEKAFEVLSRQPVDVVLADINLPGAMNGIDLMRELKAIHPDMQFLMCTVYEDSELVFKALKIGASGYILKNMPPHKIQEAIREIHAGGSPMSAPIARMVINSFQQSSVVPNEAIKLLTSREQELLRLLADGYRYKEISDKMFISINTIRSHIRNIYRKLEVQSRIEAINKIYPHP